MGATSHHAPALRDACARGPVLAGPLDMDLLLHHHPGTPAEPAVGGSDHYVVVLEAGADGAGGTVLLHDPHGHPYATLPAGDFAAAWRADGVDYTDSPYVMRADFVRVRAVPQEEALRAALPGAVAWLGGRTDRPVPAGTLGGAAAVEALTDQVERGLDPGVRAFLEHFAVRVGVRRLADAASCLRGIGLTGPAAVLTRQARLLGSVQHPLVQGDAETAAARLRELAPTYALLRTALVEQGRP